MVPVTIQQLWLLRHAYANSNAYQLMGVCVLDYISTWYILYNQMEATEYPSTACQTLTMFIDGLPMNIVSYITLYDNIMVSLNEPNDSLLPNIH